MSTRGQVVERAQLEPVHGGGFHHHHEQARRADQRALGTHRVRRAAHVQHVLAPGWAGHEGPVGLLLEDRPPQNFMAVPLLSAGTGISAMLPSSSIQRAAGRCPARSGRRRRRGASNWAKSARVHAPRAGRLAGDSRGLAKHNKKKARWSAACTPKRRLSGGHARAGAPLCGIAACGAAPCTARART